MVTEVRSAGIEGFVILAVIYLVLNLVTRAGKKAAQGGALPSADPPARSASSPPGAASLEQIMREIQRVKREKEQRNVPGSQRKQAVSVTRAAPPARRKEAPDGVDRGPLGRQSRTRLPSAEEVEERTSLEAGSRESGERVVIPRTQRGAVDSDDSAEEVVQRRIREAEARNRPLNASDHQRFDAQVRAAAETPEAKPVLVRSRLQDALVWREILGPPKSME